MTFTQMLASAEAAHPLVLDGGLGTALETRGVDLSHELWSADLIREDPDTLFAVHSAFAAVGARILTTASYQATPLGFARAGLSPAEGRELITRSVEIARSAAVSAPSSGTGPGAGDGRVLVAGSVGPYGAALGGGEEYTGDYRLTSEEYTAFHRPRIAALAEAGADLLAVETQPRLDEIRAILLLAEEVGLPVWVSVTVREGTDTPVALPDCSYLAELAEVASTSATVQAVGVNCVRPSLVTPALTELATHTDLPLIAYPNSGETYDADTMEWRDDGAEAGVGSWPVETWTRLGARIIGGCCRVRPDDIAVLSERTRR
ncbi:homocysteine S-methyltransferase [Brevibacterium oceani]|uniref:homocysteine S-methyltransferase n=1 Tax=Brevibacterium oceani TaxID=358099 RepID=UPI0015E7A828|nr:homocysteine S-methyltransferase [Brevibacterium oceani]